MDAKEDASMATSESKLGENYEISMEAMAKSQFKVDVLQDRAAEVEESVRISKDDSQKKMEILWRRVKTTNALLTYLKSKARTVAVLDLAQTSCGIEQHAETGLVDKNDVPLFGWSKNVDLSAFDCSNDEKWMGIGRQQGLIDELDAAYSNEMLKSVQMVADVMETLFRRAIVAESVTAIEKEKVILSQQEVQRKVKQIESMSLKLEEMELFALGTNNILNDMRQRVEDLVEETNRQKQRATENEQELCRVKRDFESLKSYVKSLISVRETLISSEKQFQTIERLFERLVAKTTQLEAEKMQKEAEVQKLMEENVRLTGLVDKKEAQLLAMNEQCKMMALSASMNSK